MGLPFVARARGPLAYDCWGLIRAVLLEAGHDLPLFLDDGVATHEQKARLDQWRPIHPGNPQPFDIVAFSLGKGMLHLGLVCESVYFLHTATGRPSGVESFVLQRWRSRLKGFIGMGVRWVPGWIHSP